MKHYFCGSRLSCFWVFVSKLRLLSWINLDYLPTFVANQLPCHWSWA
uniref:Uncharacterized protein n=1 Tax=Anguilla anguilla TaxID=7936 RepID=A0A0E9STN5_ANGAN